MKIPKINVKKTAGLVGGAAAANVVSNKLLANQNQYIAKGAPLVLGLFLSASRDSLMSGLGDGMIATAGSNLLSGVVPGIGADVLMGEDVLMGGADSVDFSGATPEGAEMSY
jgi:hypothetical protein